MRALRKAIAALDRLGASVERNPVGATRDRQMFDVGDQVRSLRGNHIGERGVVTSVLSPGEYAVRFGDPSGSIRPDEVERLRWDDLANAKRSHRDRLAARAAARNPAGDPHVYADGHPVRAGDRVRITRGQRIGDVDFVGELTRTSLDWPAVNLRRGGLFGVDEIEFAGFRPDHARPRTPGYNTRLRIAFTTDRNNQPIAYYEGASRRWIRIGHDKAEMLVTGNYADEVPYVRWRAP